MEHNEKGGVVMLHSFIALIMSFPFLMLRLTGSESAFPKPLSQTEEDEYVRRAVGGDIQRDYCLVAQMIVCDELVVIEQLCVGKPEVVCRGRGERFLVVAHHVIREVAHKTARELRSAGNFRRAVFRNERVKEFRGVFDLGRLAFARKLLDNGCAAVQSYALFRLDTDIRIAPPAVLIVYRFEDKAVDERFVERVEKVYGCERIHQQLMEYGNVPVFFKHFCDLFLRGT